MTRRIIVVSVVIAIAVLAWLTLGRSRGVEQATSPAATTPGVQGTSGIEGMTGMQDADAGIALGADDITTFGVTFGVVESRELDATVRSTGVVTIDEARVAQVTSKVAGFVEQLHVNTTGASVRRGQPLYELYSPQLVAAQEELLAAATLDRQAVQAPMPGLPAGGETLLAAAKRRLRLWDVSEQQIGSILRAGTASRRITFVSPVGGVVLERHVVVGQAISAGEPLLTIADLGTLWVEADLREADMQHVRLGTRATIEFAGQPGKPVDGVVTFLAPTVMGDARTVRARIVVPNRDGRLRPGMYATVNLATATATVLAVPTAAVVRTGTRDLVFVASDSDRIIPRAVVTGRIAGGYTEIITGLSAGQRIVTSAQYLLESESNLSDIMRSMIGQGRPDAMPPMNDMKMEGSGGAPADEKGADVKGMPGMEAPRQDRP